MIRKFRHRGLQLFFTKSDSRKIATGRAERIERQLDRLDVSTHPEDMNLPGWKWHPLKGDRKGTYAVAVSGNWRITFRFDADDAFDVDLEDYH
jgi:proteic killer suppression protein